MIYASVVGPRSDEHSGYLQTTVGSGAHIGGIVDHRLPSSAVLESHAISDAEHGWSIEFGDGRAQWSVAGESGLDEYDAVEVSEGKVFVDIWLRSHNVASSLTLVLDLSRRVYLLVGSVCPPGLDGAPRQEFVSGRLDGIPDVPSGDRPSETTALAGKRIRTTYSDKFIFEHTYRLDSLDWTCVQGESPGSSGVDPATCWDVGDQQFVVGFREPSMACSSVFLMDLSALRCTGKYLWYEDITVENGALGSLLQLLPDGSHAVA